MFSRTKMPQSRKAENVSAKLLLWLILCRFQPNLATEIGCRNSVLQFQPLFLFEFLKEFGINMKDRWARLAHPGL
jgi:hypothetical protein